MENLSERVESEVTGKFYPLADAMRILNVKQAMFYMKNNVELYDIYPSQDFKTGNDVLVFIFSKSQSRPYYEQWLANRWLAKEIDEQ